MAFLTDGTVSFLVSNPRDVASANTTVTDLFADTGYKFRVLAQNMYGIGVPSFESGMSEVLPLTSR